MTRRRRLGILLTHPVQYFGPLFRCLAENPTVDRSVLVDAVMQLVWTGVGSQFSATPE